MIFKITYYVFSEEDFANSEIKLLDNTNTIVSFVQGITNYTVSSTGRYESLTGESYTPTNSDVYLSNLPEFDITNKVTSDAFYSSYFSLIDDRTTDKEVILLDSPSSNTLKYVKNGETFTLEGEYGLDYDSNVVLKIGKLPHILINLLLEYYSIESIGLIQFMK